jgi:hypothetical protein
VLAAATRGERAIRVEPTGVTVPAGEVLAGLDLSGGRHLLVPLTAGASFKEDRRSAGVQIRQVALEESETLTEFADVVCLVPRLNDLFADVAADMLEVLATDEADPPRVCKEVLDNWRELLDRPDPRLLGPQQLAGLFGELLLVEELSRQNPASALDAWTGPAKRQHDFARGHSAIEVKTTTVREGRIVEIHGVEQLEPPLDGSLHLSFVRLDVDSDGLSVPLLIDRILGLGTDRAALLELLARAGYDPTRAAEYDFPRFVVRERRFYEVNDSFPKITPDGFTAGSVPAGVLRLRYDVDLTGEPPYPLEPAAVTELITAVATAR